MDHTLDSSAKRRVDADEAILNLGARQHGVVTRAQLLGAGVLPDAVDRRLKAKRLRALHRGVYVVGPILSPRAPAMAAVLACGGRGVLSHCSAAILWQLEPSRRGAAPLEVSTSGGAHPRLQGVRVHRLTTLRPDDITVLDCIPITTVPRTILDLAGVLAQRDLERTLAESFSRGLANRDEILAAAARSSRLPGTARLRSLLAHDEEPALTQSAAEKRFLALIRRAQLPRPVVNASVGGYRVDFFWRAERFIVEIDGYAFHSQAPKFESDRRRDAELAAAGVRVVRVTWQQLLEEPEAVLVRLALALARTPSA